ncbi:hypothetical protein [Bifidobacterium sp. SO1]|uniref:hypothetical protein n=1 Tax=Bifidobacterium sp. SO1 TaxID=2809029 RepID=UPI001F0AA1A7|nr:hypothetical protein [Bifidobacterium sp. SO1]
MSETLGYPRDGGLWADRDNVLWVAAKTSDGAYVLRLWDTDGMTDQPMLFEEADLDGYMPFTPVTKLSATGDYVDTPYDGHGLYRDRVCNDLWVKDGNVLRQIRRADRWLVDGTETPAVDSPYGPWMPVSWSVVRDVEETPWKPTKIDPHAIVCSGRVVTFPPVESFGRLERDKWLAVKNLEESAELVEASKRWLKSGSAADRIDMLSELADVIQTVANLTVAFDITDRELSEALDACRERNRKKGRL